ncbi:hypothetical protein WJX84_008800 [Apatococcus fuscideae]|uniref:Uncharacterized protein n=1 Tax=Apatococcus fuscideae TaxID=2026836 RepID=A0AAW1TAX3_9CHLO
MDAAEAEKRRMENSFRLPSPPTSLYDTIQIVPSNFLPLAQRNGALHSAKSLATQRNPQTLCVPSTPRSALELTLAASLTLGNTPNSPTHRPASLERAAKGSGKQPAVAKLTLEAGASPRSIAVSDALIDGFQSDPASHETFRPVHYTAKAAQRAAKLAHLKAARQAQRLQLGLGPAIVIGSATDGYVSPTRKAPGDVTLKRGLESLERCWQSHAGPSNLIPSLQARRSGSGCLDLPVEPAATNNTACTSPQLYSQGDPPKCCQTAAGDPDRCPEQEHSDGQSSSQAASAVAASPSRLFMGNATLDKNLQSLQRRWDSQKSRQLQKGQRSPHRKKSIDQKQS